MSDNAWTERYGWGPDGTLPGYQEFYIDELPPELLLEAAYPDSVVFAPRAVPAYDAADNASLSIPKALVPLLAGLVRFLEWGALWDDEAAGYQVAALLQERIGQ
jgi:hypothetical protein